MASANYDIPHEQGTDFVLNINYYDENANPVYLDTNFKARMDIRGQRYEYDKDDLSVKIRFSTDNMFGYTGYSGETYYGIGGTWGKIAGHISLNGEYIYGSDWTGGTASGITGQISLSFPKEISKLLNSGSYLYDLFLWNDRGLSYDGATAYQMSERLLAGKFIVSPSISNPDLNN